ncbi:MAG: peptide ABC transporter substrate-binding protein, partial [Gammaproteobacteria bacterium]|nr:peptide ABC transporter substrate-binding protein [Gammaproteobacteria bacterium]
MGCTSEQASNVESGTENQILHIGNGTEPQDLDPHIVTGVTEHNIITSLIEGLVSKHPENLNPEPGMAESWEISDDGKTYIFNLRQDAKWSNGDPVTAHDFVYSWKRALTPELGNQYAYMLYLVENAEAFNNGTLNNFDEVGVHAIDDKTLEVTLNHSTPYFLGILDHYSTFPVHADTIEKFGDISSRGSEWTRAGNFIGNGPF